MTIHKLPVGLLLLCSLVQLTSCALSTAHPSDDEQYRSHQPIHGAVAGAIAGASGMAIARTSPTAVALGGIGGGVIGYWLATLYHGSTSSPAAPMTPTITYYELGEYVAIDLPSYQLFTPNTATFLPSAQPLLAQVVTVLARHPQNNILVTGNTSGFDRLKRENPLARQMAQQVALYLKQYGLADTHVAPAISMPPRIEAIGYANYFPVANDITLNGISANNHIHITAYPRLVSI